MISKTYSHLLALTYETCSFSSALRVETSIWPQIDLFFQMLSESSNGQINVLCGKIDLDVR